MGLGSWADSGIFIGGWYSLPFFYMIANEPQLKDAAPWLQYLGKARISLLLFAVIILAKLPLAGSLWLDEGITAWITKDTLQQAISRAVEFQGQSPLYFMLSWGVQLVLGSSELSLRILSILGVCGATFLLVRLGRRLGGVEYGWFVGAVFLAFDPVQVAAASARPYGVALFFSVMAIAALIKWEERGGILYSLLYFFSFLMSVYLQYLFACMLVVHAMHVILHFRTQRVPLSSYIFRVFLIAACLVPAALHILDLEGRHAALQFIPAPRASSLLRALFPPVLLIGGIGAILIAAVFSNSREIQWCSDRKRCSWIILWYLFPPLLLFGISVFSGTSLFIDRYFLTYAPAVAMLFAAIPFIWKDPRTRAISLLAMTLLLAMREVDRRWVGEDWRGAAKKIATLGAEVPVLLYPGLAESKEVAWLQNEGKQEYLSAPLLYYRVPNPIVLLPPPGDSNEINSYFEGLAGKVLKEYSNLAFVGLEQRLNSRSTTKEWIEKLHAQGLAAQEHNVSRDSKVKFFTLNRMQSQEPDDLAASRAPASDSLRHSKP